MLLLLLWIVAECFLSLPAFNKVDNDRRWMPLLLEWLVVFMDTAETWFRKRRDSCARFHRKADVCRVPIMLKQESCCTVILRSNKERWKRVLKLCLAVTCSSRNCLLVHASYNRSSSSSLELLGNNLSTLAWRLWIQFRRSSPVVLFDFVSAEI